MTGKHSDISLYFHVPFCSKKCPYCHFFVLPDKPAFKEQFLHSIAQEWQLKRPYLDKKKIVSIYFGGGTPSRLNPGQLKFLFDLVLESGVEIDPSCEITLELNPEDASLAHLQALYQIGINRLSIGIQSLDDEQLGLLQRQHGSKKAIDAIVTAAKAGFSNISIDLMYDIPRQTLSSWKNGLKRLHELPITHLSLYNLTFEPHTGFFKRKQELMPHLPSQEESLELLQTAVKEIENQGFKRYEISAFAKTQMHSRHNIGYWTARPFLGFGPSAFSYWEKARFRNIANLNRYSEMLAQSKFPVDFEETLEFPNNLYELFAVQLRLSEGIDFEEFEKTHGNLPASFEKRLDELISQGLMEKNDSRFKLSEKGILFYDSVATHLI